MNETLAAYTPRALSVLRIVTGLLIIQHGMGKLLGFPALPAYANVQLMSLSGAAGVIELIGGALLILGLWTQPVAFILSGEMAFAYFIGHMFKAGIAVPQCYENAADVILTEAIGLVTDVTSDDRLCDVGVTESSPRLRPAEHNTSQLFAGFAGVAFREMLAYSEATCFGWLLRAAGNLAVADMFHLKG